jgi:hypothetical protein
MILIAVETDAPEASVREVEATIRAPTPKGPPGVGAAVVTCGVFHMC